MSLLFNILDKSHMLKIQCVSDHLRSSLSLQLPGCIRAQQRSMANLEGCGSFTSFFFYKFLYCLNLFKIKNEVLMLLNLGSQCAPQEDKFSYQSLRRPIKTVDLIVSRKGSLFNVDTLGRWASDAVCSLFTSIFQVQDRLKFT